MTTMPNASTDVTAALATLQDRWGAAAPRRLGMGEERDHGTTIGALATVPLERPDIEPLAPVLPADGSVVPTGFAALDAILGLGGIPRQAGLAVRGDHSSGKTTLALRLVAEAQAAGSIVAWLDLARGLDPVEAVARGVRLDWLVVLAPETLDEGLAMAGALLQGRTVDLLVADLTGEARTATQRTATQPQTDTEPPAAVPPRTITDRGHGRAPSTADRLHRLAALARRAGTLLVVLAPPNLPGGLTGAVAESTGLHLELARRSWIRLGRDVVGQRTEVTVARNRFGPPGRRAELRILYAEGGERDGCLVREPLLRETLPAAPPGRRPTGPVALAATLDPIADAPAHPFAEIPTHATAPPPLAASPAPARPVALHVVPARTGDPGRAAVDPGRGSGRQPGGRGDGRPAGDAAGERAPARA